MSVSRSIVRVAAAGLLALLALSPAVAVVRAAVPLQITTPYPSVSVGPGTKVSFDLTVHVTERERVAVAVTGVPDGWSATLHGGGFIVSDVVADPTTPPALRLDVSVPAQAKAGVYAMHVTAASGSERDELEVDVRVVQGAEGDITLTSDYPSLQGPVGQAFTFDLTLTNGTLQDQTYTVTATGPAGWQVTATIASQAQAASATVTAGSTASITVSATAPDGTDAGTYPINVEANVNGQKIGGQLSVDIVGSYKLTLTTPDGRLNTQGPSGTATEEDLVVENDGTAALTGVKVTADAPSGWTVDFSPAQVDVAPGAQETVVARITPSTSALTGDYVITMTATGDQGSGTQDIRFTVETSTTWALIGIAIIVVTLVVLAAVFRRYGRR